MKVFAKKYKEEIDELAHKVAMAEGELRSHIEQAPQFTVEPGLIFARYNPLTNFLSIEQNIPLNHTEIINLYLWLSNLITEEPDPPEPQAVEFLQPDISQDQPF